MNSPFKTNTINWKLQTLIQIRTSMFMQVPHTLRQELAAYKAKLNLSPEAATAPPATATVEKTATTTAEAIQDIGTSTVIETQSAPIVQAEAPRAELTEESPVAIVESTLPLGGEPISAPTSPTPPTEAPVGIVTVAASPEEKPKAKEKPAKSAEDEEAEAREKLSLDALIARIEKFKAKMAAGTPAPVEPPVATTPAGVTEPPKTEAPGATAQPISTPTAGATVATVATVATESMKRFVLPEFGGSVHATGAVPDFATAQPRSVSEPTQPDRQPDALAETIAPKQVSAEFTTAASVATGEPKAAVDTIATESMRRYVPLDLEGGASKPRNSILGEPTFPTAKKFKPETEEASSTEPNEPGAERTNLTKHFGQEQLQNQGQKLNEAQAPTTSTPKPGVLDVIASEERLKAQTDSMQRFVLPDFGAVDPAPFPRLNATAEPAHTKPEASEAVPTSVSPAIQSDALQPGEVVARANAKEFVLPEFGHLEQTVRLPKGESPMVEAGVAADRVAQRSETPADAETTPAYNPPGPTDFQISAQTESLRRFVMPDFGVQSGTLHLENKPSFVEGAVEVQPVPPSLESVMGETVSHPVEPKAEVLTEAVSAIPVVEEVTTEVALAEALTAEHASESSATESEEAPEELESLGLNIAAESAATQPAGVSLANLGELRISEVSLKMEVVNGKLKLVLDLPPAALNELGQLLGVKQGYTSAQVPEKINQPESVQPSAETVQGEVEPEVQMATMTEEAPTAIAATEQMSESITQLDNRISHFRQNLERIRAKGMAHPTDSTIQAIQRRYLDRIIEGMAPLQSVGTISTPNYAVESLLEQPIARETSDLDNLIAKVESFSQNRPLPESGLLEGVELSESASIEELDPDLLTETLAEIHVQQGKTTEAIRVFEKLQLKFPDKSSYFASRISDILKQS